MRVLKFGGTSVANAQRFQDVAEIALDTAKRSQTSQHSVSSSGRQNNSRHEQIL